MAEEGDIIYSNSPNVQVADSEGVYHRAQLVATTEGEIRFNDPDNSPNVMVADSEGVYHRAQLVAMIGGGGKDRHNKGWFATESALTTAYPTAEDGDFAIVGETDTVWVWDSDNSTWIDTDTKGQVTSVNNQTGDVTVQATLVNQQNIKSVNGNSLLGSGNLELSTSLAYPVAWTTNSTTKAFCDAVAADTTATVGKTYLGEVTFSDLPASMVNAEVVVEIMDGTTAANKVIVLSLKSGNVSPYAWQYVYWNGGSNTSGWKTWQEPLVSGTNIKTVNNTSLLGSGNITIDSLPTQTGNSGKFLTTDGSSASWATVDALPSQTGQSGKVLGTNGTTASWETPTTITFRTWGANE